MYAGWKPVCCTDLVLECIWYVLVCNGIYWYVMACIEFLCSTLVLALRTHVGTFCGMYWHVLGKYWHVLKHNMCWSQRRGLYCFKYCCMYQYARVCIGLYGPVYACIRSRIDCKHSNLVPYCTSIHISCNIYCWYASNELVFGFSFCRMVRGKDHGPSIDVEQCASSSRLNHIVTFNPRIARIHPALHSVLNGASITSWYQRQTCQAHSRPLNRAWGGTALTNLCLGCH